jgi:glycosyltransferase involved in cell wall biosynthesis
MNIVWFSWKDTEHPESGGAEVVSGELMKNLVKDGHDVTLITARYKNSASQEFVSGVRIIRVGNKLTVYPAACLYYLKHLRKTSDVTIDEMNTIPFFIGVFAKSTKRLLLVHQLARKVWFYQMPFPLSLIGYLCEPIILRLISGSYSATLAVSRSTKLDLNRYRFNNVSTFRVGMGLKPLDKLPAKKPSGNVLVLGAVRPMKRTLDAVKAFELARDKNNGLNLTIAGDISTSYASKVISYIEQSRHNGAINIRGRVSMKEKTNLMRISDVILVTSVKEGWGLIVTEANSQGTPAIAYDTDGLRDSVRNNITGYLCTSGDYDAMSALINKLLSNKKVYESFRIEAWQYSKQFTFKNSYDDFSQHL